MLVHDGYAGSTPASATNGEVAERSIAPISKAGVPFGAPGVRIPPSPLYLGLMEKNSLRGMVRSVLREVIEFSNLRFDAEEVANFVTDYIRHHKIGERQISAAMWEYELPIEAKQDFEEVGFSLFSVENVINPKHPDYGKQYVLVKSWPKVD